MDARVLDQDLPDDDDSPDTFESSSDVADGEAGQGNSIWDARQFNGQFPPPIQWTIPPPIRSTIPLPIQWMLVFQIGTAPTTTIPPPLRNLSLTLLMAALDKEIQYAASQNLLW
ncbi:unnamed protein product [Linum trigynum]|uniref:Uncharacterized protein n=1 Tax=Linum trigynum TaxID=586398 RepID=A0AAV2GEY6_9ROSI